MIKNVRNKILLFIIFFITTENIFPQNDIKWFPVSHRIVNNSNGTGATLMDQTQIPYIMSELNRAFLPAGIQFYMGCPGIDTINNNFNTHLQQQYHCLKPPTNLVFLIIFIN